MPPDPGAPGAERLFCRHPFGCTLILALAYWGLSHLAWMLFHALGVLPLPIWPAAGLAFAASFHGGWRAAPGIALGSLLANRWSLGASWELAAGICLMNAIGPVVGAALARQHLTVHLRLRSLGDLLLLVGIALALVPLATACGGIGSKWLLGLTSAHAVPIDMARWAVAHAIGTVLVGTPLLIWLKGRVSHA